MAKLSPKGLVAVALVFSLAAAVLVYSYLKGLADQTVRQGLPVVVAKADIPPKTKMTADMLQVVNVPPEYIQPGAVQEVGKAVGAVVRDKIVAGEQITQRRLFIAGQSSGFTGIIPPDKRAVSVAVTEVTGVAGLVRPGDYVDVIVTFDTNIIGEHLSQIFLQNVRVLAVNRETETGAPEGAKKEASSKMTVTLAVSPDEAARLTVAEEKGKIRLVLRPYLPSDVMVVTNALKPRDIVNASAPPAAPQAATGGAAPAPSPKGIQVIRGTKTEMIPVN
ncbi:Flp pilus assembly protein CpaB [Anaeroselena agilis]|uniref:Flp pilus assembly protein CpaB n=1 Tax=Anaeroselena agilis TaxID=3063788 RepID=A0ABU3P693_9FIRM|nr:Flp pilus assembly protein CpaB [Selenomonadales bacterium 4137-cl]